MNLRNKQIAVTGATGFLGRYIVESLLKRKARVVGVVRNPGRVPELQNKGVELRKADLAEPETLAKGFQGVDAIVSNAALFSISNLDWQSHLRANVKGTENVFEAAHVAAVRRIIHVSSVAVYRRHQQPLSDEDQPLLREQDLGWFNAYPVSKALSEQMAWQKARDYSLELTCVRPCAIFGAHDPNFTTYVKRAWWLPIAPVPVAAKVGLVYAGDVAEGIAMALENDVSIGKAYNLTGADQSLWEFYRAWRKERGGQGAILPIPVPMPLRRIWSNARAELDLDWRSRPIEETVRETLALERKLRER